MRQTYDGHAADERDEAGTVLERRQVSTQPEKCRAFLESVRQRAGEAGYMTIVEVCRFNDWFLALLPEMGCREIVLLHPEKKSRIKTDRRDADQLGELLWVNRTRLARGEQPRGLRRDRASCAKNRQKETLISTTLSGTAARP